MLGYCPTCDLVFPQGIPPNVVMRNVTFVNCGAGACPRCNQPARTLDGTYDAANGEIQFRSGPPLTIEIIQRLSRFAKDPASKGLAVHEIIEEVANISPEIANELRAHKGISASAILIFLFLLISKCNFNIELDINKLINDAQGVSESSNKSSNSKVVNNINIVNNNINNVRNRHQRRKEKSKRYCKHNLR